MSQQPFGETQPIDGGGDYVEFGGPPRRPGRSARPALSIAAVAAVALLGGAGVAYAVAGSGGSSPHTVSANSGASATPSALAKPPKPPQVKCMKSGSPCVRFGLRPFPALGFPLGMGLGLGGGLVHGQVVIGKPGGGYETVDVQSGKVTAVSSTSITIKSADGYSATYAIASSTIVDAQRDGIGSVKTGNEVSLTATVSGSKATATSVTDLSLLSRGGYHVFPWKSAVPQPGASTGGGSTS